MGQHQLIEVHLPEGGINLSTSTYLMQDTPCALFPFHLTAISGAENSPKIDVSEKLNSLLKSLKIFPKYSQWKIK